MSTAGGGPQIQQGGTRPASRLDSPTACTARPPSGVPVRIATLLIVLLATPQPGAAQTQCRVGFKRCSAPGAAGCIPRGTCCTSADCPLANDFCPAPGALCRCNAGFKRCIASSGARCIRQGTCCTNADCPLANDLCPGPGAQCRCAAGFKLCSAPAAGIRRCIPKASCCTTADCLLSNDVCPGAGLQCRCAPGFKFCSTAGTGGTAVRACIPTSSCCTNADCASGGSTCPSPGQQCRCAPGFKPCTIAGSGGTSVQSCIPVTSCCTSADCRPPSNTCLVPGKPCRCPVGQKLCDTTVGGVPFRGCILNTTCCTNSDCGQLNSRCALAGYSSCSQTPTLGWGKASAGQVGNNAPLDSYVPSSLRGLGLYLPLPFVLPLDHTAQKVLSISAGYEHTCAATQFTLGGETIPLQTLCWGRNDKGQLGTGDQVDSAIPMPVKMATVAAWYRTDLQFTHISAGWKHTCGIAGSASAAHCWGEGRFGQLGRGGTADSATPVPVWGGYAWRTLSAGSSHTCGITLAGAARCWGAGSQGQLGGNLPTIAGEVPNTLIDRFNRPITTGWRKIAAGSDFTCGIRADDTAACWGGGQHGQLGNGGTSNAYAPVEVAGSLKYHQLAAGHAHVCGILKTDFTATCWGLNSFGQLGDGGTKSSSTPVLVAGGHRFGADHAGFDPGIAAGERHSCALLANGSAVCWGAAVSDGMLPRYYGELGTGFRPRGSPFSRVPELVPLPWSGSASQIVAGGYHTCAIQSGTNGSIACFGKGNYGQLGADLLPPVLVEPAGVRGDSTFVSFTSVTAGSEHTCGIDLARRAVCWGSLLLGILGNGWVTWLNRFSYSQALVVSRTLELWRTPWNQLSAGGGHTCGILSDATLVCWGDGRYGQCGRGRLLAAGEYIMPTAEPVSGNRAYRAVSAGAQHTCAILATSVLHCFGNNEYGQLGLGLYRLRVDAYDPTEVPGGLRFDSVAAGRWHTCGTLVNGSLACWGRGNSGQLGGNTFLDAASPKLVAGSRLYSGVTAGEEHTCALDYDGRSEAFCWGLNRDGQLGLGHKDSVAVPKTVKGGIIFLHLSAGNKHTCGVTADQQEAVCWGRNAEGQMGVPCGNESRTHCGSTVPVRIPGFKFFKQIAAGGNHTVGILR